VLELVGRGGDHVGRRVDLVRLEGGDLSFFPFLCLSVGGGVSFFGECVFV
jgi:hypothetical protein